MVRFIPPIRQVAFYLLSAAHTCRSTIARVRRSELPVFSSISIKFSAISIPTSQLIYQLNLANMAGLGKAPYVPQDVQEVQTLIRNLEGSTKKESKASKKAFSCKKTAFDVVNSPEKITVNSWRFQDWDYKRDDLPTYARGLFTSKNEKGQPEICIRGYDKFFNTEEVNATKWRNIENNTKGPYELSLKENGCIIFISGLHDGTLLVCSKHSTGPRGDETKSHAVAGEHWIDKQLAAVGKSRGDLARELRRRNATAVAELCDDDFEEHILAYAGDNAGLYLHGININIPEFMTYSGPQVQAFAKEWGFRKTDFLVLDNIQTTKTFLDQVAETGSYNGRDVEGFVIRCKSQEKASGSLVDWFFKYKFEEPYLMYRQWRECTKALIAGKPPRFKKHVKITEEYLLYARRQLAENRGMGKEYAANHGIIKLRDDFLKEKNLKGSDIIRAEYAITGGPQKDAAKDIILVPIATLGCGKTTLAVALVHLFGWGHVQNDNIQGKGRPPRFTKEVLTQLEQMPVVFADRNNAQRHERQQIIGDVKTPHPEIRLVALNFVHTPDTISKIREVTQNRVLSRGDNHQTIQAASDQNKVLGIMEGFIHRFEALNPYAQPDDGFDAVIDLDPTANSRHNLETVISQLSELFPKLITDMPSSEDLDDAINVALSDYKPDIRHTIGDRGPKNNKNNKKGQQFVSPFSRKHDIHGH
jgi:tRNA ligase